MLKESFKPKKWNIILSIMLGIILGYIGSSITPVGKMTNFIIFTPFSIIAVYLLLGIFNLIFLTSAKAYSSQTGTNFRKPISDFFSPREDNIILKERIMKSIKFYLIIAGILLMLILIGIVLEKLGFRNPIVFYPMVLSLGTFLLSHVLFSEILLKAGLDESLLFTILVLILDLISNLILFLIIATLFATIKHYLRKTCTWFIYYLLPLIFWAIYFAIPFGMMMAVAGG
jgi:hypothetical protein